MNAITIGIWTSALLFATGVISVLCYALRDFSRSRLSHKLQSAGKSKWLDPTVEHAEDLIYITASIRLVVNTLIVLAFLKLFVALGWSATRYHYFAAAIVAILATLIASIAVPLALANYVGESFIALFIAPLHFLRIIFRPIIALMRWIDYLVRESTNQDAQSAPEQIANEIENEILSVVQEGEKEGVVKSEERQMIESVIEFRDTQVGQIMTIARFGLNLSNKL